MKYTGTMENKIIETQNATIKDISDLKTTKSGRQYVVVYIANDKDIAGRFLVFRNSIKNFDIIRQFEREIFKVGDLIRFTYQKSKNGFNYISKMKHMK
jgi:hypothetical protein